MLSDSIVAWLYGPCSLPFYSLVARRVPVPKPRNSRLSAFPRMCAFSHMICLKAAGLADEAKRLLLSIWQHNLP